MRTQKTQKSFSLFFKLWLLLPFLLSFSCNDDEGIQPVNIVQDEEVIPFEELSLLVKIKTPTDNFLAVEKIDALNLFVNGKFWAQSSSLEVDTSRLNTVTEIDNRLESESAITYAVNSKQVTPSLEFNTVGDYVQFINQTIQLEPGEYLCFIESFQIETVDGTVETYYPQKYIPFKVENNTRSAFVGEVELSLE